MKNIYTIIMLGVLLAPSLAVINWSNAQQTATVTQVAGSADANNPQFFVPAELTVTVGTTVTWLNDDSATHTVVSGDVNDPENWGKVFNSGLNKPRTTFEHTFDTPGEYTYLCELHPWMIGKIIVVEEMPMPPEGKMMPGEMMTGTNLDLMISPTLPFDRMTGEKVTLSFTAKAKELGGASISPGKIDHLDYKVVITKDGMEVWSSDVLHDHDGNLELEITPSSGPITVTGGEGNPPSTGPYMVSGPIFTENGNYAISGQVVGIEFNPLPSPLKDDFSMEVVPEFPITAILPMVVAFGAVIAVMRLRPKLSL